MIPGRFDYIKYDDHHTQVQAAFKEEFTKVEKMIEQNIMSPRARALALTKLEETYMWVGKAIRDDQIGTNIGTQLNERRG